MKENPYVLLVRYQQLTVAEDLTENEVEELHYLREEIRQVSLFPQKERIKWHPEVDRNDACFLYYLEDVHGLTLYVGITGDPEYRARTHRVDKNFYLMNVVWNGSREDMMALEKQIINHYLPPLNNDLYDDEGRKSNWNQIINERREHRRT